ncbi:hypothetical protein [Actinoplanes sp. NPDC049802]|uniref:hypothetical protein n=1 Tax=Actinoplanes sp. NPDC049802 TaxID=3154742 RepID=UPI0033CB9E95
MATAPDDPHIHVEAGPLRSRAAERHMLASTFGLTADLPATVQTACGRRVPYAMTSGAPESVTCLPCREHASEQHLRFAVQVETLGAGPGAPFDAHDAATAAAAHRDLARRFAS